MLQKGQIDLLLPEVGSDSLWAIFMRKSYSCRDHEARKKTQVFGFKPWRRTDPLTSKPCGKRGVNTRKQTILVFRGVCVCVCVCCKKNELGLQFVSPQLLCWDFPGDPEVKALSSHCRGKWQVKMKSLSRVQLFETPWTVAHQAPPSVGFSRQKYWSWLPFPSPRDLLNPGIGPRSPAL